MTNTMDERPRPQMSVGLQIGFSLIQLTRRYGDASRSKQPDVLVRRAYAMAKGCAQGGRSRCHICALEVDCVLFWSVLSTVRGRLYAVQK